MKHWVVLLSFLVLSLFIASMISERTHVEFSNTGNSHTNIMMKDIQWFFLTTGLNTTRREHMLEEFKDFRIQEVNPVLSDDQTISRVQSVATGFLRMIDRGLRGQDTTKPFQPFVLLEDDASKFRTIPHSINIPVNCDLLYIGLSTVGAPDDEDWKKANGSKAFYTPFDNNLIKIHNMLAMHGIMVCSSAGANLITRCTSEGFYTNTVCDVPLAISLSLYNVYALIEPLVYQDKRYDGQESATKITANSLKEHAGDFNPSNSIHKSFARATSSLRK